MHSTKLVLAMLMSALTLMRALGQSDIWTEAFKIGHIHTNDCRISCFEEVDHENHDSVIESKYRGNNVWSVRLINTFMPKVDPAHVDHKERNAFKLMQYEGGSFYSTQNGSRTKDILAYHLRLNTNTLLEVVRIEFNQPAVQNMDCMVGVAIRVSR
jgi:hypothetical protein